MTFPDFGCLDETIPISTETVCFISGPEVIKLFPCSTERSMKFFQFINVKMPTVVGKIAF